MDISHAEKRARAKRVFLEFYSQLGLVLHAVEQGNALLEQRGDERALSRKLVNYWRETDEEFDADCRLAERDAAERLEQEAIRRAKDGWDEPVFGRGEGEYAGTEQVGVIRKYSDTLLIFTLKGLNPQKFGDALKVTGANGGPVQVESAREALALRLEQLIERRALMAASIDAEVVEVSPSETPTEPSTKGEGPQK